LRFFFCLLIERRETVSFPLLFLSSLVERARDENPFALMPQESVRVFPFPPFLPSHGARGNDIDIFLASFSDHSRIIPPLSSSFVAWKIISLPISIVQPVTFSSRRSFFSFLPHPLGPTLPLSFSLTQTPFDVLVFVKLRIRIRCPLGAGVWRAGA